MASDISRPLSFPSPGQDQLTTLDRSGSADAERATLGEVAAQFESMLMLEMIKQMRKSLLDEDADGEGLGKETYSSTIDSELALHLAKAGGLGLTPMMIEAWERQQTAVAPGSMAAAEAAAVPVAVAQKNAPAAAAAYSNVSAVRHQTPQLDSAMALGESALALDMPARVSSAYGWRSDPIKGQARFHGGIDLAARYGTEVPAAAAGTVVTADEQGGYGLTVVVRHPNGFQSRYAHLSSLDVQAGDAVTQGQQLGRVGSTGRSTGPHLHFEVTQGGRRVDPEQFVRNLTTDIKGQ